MKSLLLLRGLPGSGKSTLADVLSEHGTYPVLSVDSYFTDKQTGVYCFDYKENHKAYAKCVNDTAAQMTLGVEKVIVDNTFTLEWEIEPYFKLAERYHYRLFVMTVENRHGGKNIHNISQEQLDKMALKYKVCL